MPALRNVGAAGRRHGPQDLQQHHPQADCSSTTVAALSCMSASAKRRLPATLGSSPVQLRGFGPAGAGHGRAAVTQGSAKKGKGFAAGGKAGKSCAWPAYARSPAEAEAEILAAVISLYTDELKPFGRILRKRVAERILESQGIVADITNLDVLPEVDGKHVRAVCNNCKLLRINAEEGGDWSAVLVDRPQTFVDIYSPADCYDEQFWSALKAYFEGPDGSDMSLPGGRYACAQTLKAVQLPLLSGFSLGSICHVVQVAMSQKKIFGYMDGAMVPYARSQAMIKDQCAMHGQSSLNNGSSQSNVSSLPIASLEVARARLCEILNTANGEIPLSNVKRLFRSRFQLDLSETLFGFSKLSELIQDSMFSDICRVELRENGYMVVQIRHAGVLPAEVPMLVTPANAATCFKHGSLEDGPSCAPPCAAQPLSLDRMDSLTKSAPAISLSIQTPTEIEPAALQWCCLASRDAGDGFVACSVQHTFLQYKVPQTPLPGAKRRSCSLPKDMGRSEPPLASKACFADLKHASAPADNLLPTPTDDVDSTSDGSGFLGLCKSPFLTRADSSSSSTGCSSDEASYDCFPQRSLEFTSLGGASLHVDHQGSAHGLQTREGGDRVIFCPEEPLALEESEIFWGRTPDITPLSTPVMQALPPSPAMSPNPVYNYSDLHHCCQHNAFASSAQVPSSLGLAFAADSTENQISFSNIAPQTTSQPLWPGCIIRLGEYI